MVANSAKVRKKPLKLGNKCWASSLFFKERPYREPPVLLLVFSPTKLAVLP
jgi:hypothetical protein